LRITKSYGIPLIHKLYEGNTNDAKIFPQAFEGIIERYRRICLDIDKLTLVLDKGNNSEKNFKEPVFSQIHFVGSLVPSRYKELLSIPLKKYTEVKLPNDKIVKAYHCEKEVFGSNKKLIITYNEDLFEKQKNTLKTHLEKADAELLSTHWNKVKDKDKKIQKILNHYKVKDLIDVVVKDNSSAISHNKALIKERELSLGKNILFTNRFDWSDEEIIYSYRSASEIENTFKIMNDTDLVSFSPTFHWTDQKIRVHAFICILGLLLMRLAQMKLSKNGIAMSLNVMMNEFEDIKSILLIDEDGKHFQIISKRSSVQQKMFEILDLSTIASNLYLHF
jgi:transposase